MKDAIYITGHKNPDSDSICSAIAYSHFKQQKKINAIPVRLGKINRETEFILNYFNIEQPRHLATIKLSISDFNLDKLETIKPGTSIHKAWSIMKESKIQLLTVADDEKKFIGLLSLLDITNCYFNTNVNTILGDYKTPISNIVTTLNGNLILGSSSHVITSGKVNVAAMSPEVIKNYINDGDMVITGNKDETQKASIMSGAKYLIVTGSYSISPDIYNLAYNKNCFIISTPYDTFTTSRLIIQSAPIDFIMSKENIISFNNDDLIDEVKNKMIENRHKLYPVLDNDNKVIGGLARYHLISNSKKKVILLDHNEKSQSIPGIEEAEIIEIIDHHRLGDIQTLNPVYFRNEPVGSTATIITSLFKNEGINIPEKIAGLLCAAIISDTLKFKSPTCTNIDKEYAHYLAGISKIDIDTFSDEMFNAGSSFEGISEEEILFGDFKEFHIKNNLIGVSQLTTMSLDNIKEIKEKLLNYIENMNNTQYDVILVLFTDINIESSELIFSGKNEDLIRKAFDINKKEKSAFLKGIVSRKKQLIPKIANSI